MIPFVALLLLAIIQGLTEYLPVSSSGHLVLIREWLPSSGQLPSNASLEIWLHLGTLFAVMFFYKDRLRRLLQGFVGYGDQVGSERRLVLLLAVASLPAGLVGFCFEDFLSNLFNSPSFVSCALLFTGIFLWFSKGLKGDLAGGLSCLPMSSALWIGVAQALAVAPGVSRSGITIVMGLFLGLRAESAATFSFLLSIPVIVAAACLKMPELFPGGGVFVTDLLISFLVTFLVGWWALRCLVWVAKQGRLYWFAPYCWVVGVATLLKIYL